MMESTGLSSTAVYPSCKRHRRRWGCVLVILVSIGEFRVSCGNLLFRPSISASLTRAIPALSLKRTSNKDGSFLPSRAIQEVSTIIKKLPNHVGFFYGIRDDLITKKATPKPRLSDVMKETLTELREMRQEMAALRREMNRMKQGVGGEEEQELDSGVEQEAGITGLVHRRKRQREFDKIGRDVEQWAERLLFQQDGEEDGWKEVLCHKMFRKKFNKDSTTRCYIKWMKDTRGGPDTEQDDKEYPCVKCYATLDAPLEDVCAYLSDAKRLEEYNDLMVHHRDLEEISPHSKVCWGQSPKVLFIKPRDFVTYCHHRWLRDGTQVVINQAVDHPDAPAATKEKEGQVCRAYALRGANFISKDPEDPSKTRFCLVAHADPGGIPPWACKTAVNALAPIEPFKMFYKINKNVKKMPPQPEPTEMVSSITGRSARAAGLSQMGYACFWPNGGGLKEGILHHSHPQSVDPSHPEGPTNDEDHDVHDELSQPLLEPDSVDSNSI